MIIEEVTKLYVIIHRKLIVRKFAHIKGIPSCFCFIIPVAITGVINSFPICVGFKMSIIINSEPTENSIWKMSFFSLPNHTWLPVNILQLHNMFVTIVGFP